MEQELEIATPKWGLSFLEPMRYKGLKGGRGSGKSHFFAELAVEALILDPYMDIVCLREVQRSLKFSAKKLIEEKIRAFGAQDSFVILETEIRRRGATGTTGRIIFQGMQDHTADSLKSLEGFGRAWFEEASRMSQRSLELLRPTIREEDSEIWFSWNPDQETDPIEKFLVSQIPENAIVAHINYSENPFCPQVMKDEARIWQKNDPDSFGHVWLGEYNTKADDQVLHGRWTIEDFEVQLEWAGPYYGADWGFSTDPNAIVEVYVDLKTNRLYIRRELWELGVEIEDTPRFFARMPGIDKYVIRADNARPEMISYVRRNAVVPDLEAVKAVDAPESVKGLIAALRAFTPGELLTYVKCYGSPACRKIQAAEKWPGSVEDGISKLRSFSQIVVHSECPKTAEECRLYKYKRDRLTGDILPDVLDKHNHLIDSARYAIEPLTKCARQSFWD